MTWAVAAIGRLFGVTPAAANVIAIIAALAIASGAIFGGYELIKHFGAVEERAKIEQENTDAIRKAMEASRSFDDCIAAGGVWDFRRQRCSSPTLGHR